MSDVNASGKSSMLHSTLERLQGKRVILVMQDERAFKGTVGEFDEDWLYLMDVSEGSTVNARGWDEVTINTGYVGKRLTNQGVLAESEPGQLVRLKNVLIKLDSVLRVWAWESENLARPKHVRVEQTRTIF